MSEVKALYPIGKTQWRKWVPEQKIAFNEARASGVPFADAVKYVNELELVEVNIAPAPKKKHSVLDVLHDVAEVAETVADVVTTVTPVVAAVKTVAKVTKKGK